MPADAHRTKAAPDAGRAEPASPLTERQEARRRRIL
ncbi:hypothetical protein SALBM217S_00838 [Streptomyces griseoloalbus]